MQKTLPLFYFFLIIVFLTANLYSETSLTPGQYTGYTSTTSGGVTSNYNSFKIQWTITSPSQNKTQYYHYIYNLTNTSGNALNPTQTYFLLGLSSAAATTNGSILNVNTGFTIYSQSEGGINAISFSTPSNPVSAYSFDSTRAPVWGDFYAQASNNIWAYNTGINTPASGSNFTNWVPTPGSLGVASSEPQLVLIMGSFLFMAFFLKGKNRPLKPS